MFLSVSSFPNALSILCIALACHLLALECLATGQRSSSDLGCGLIRWRNSGLYAPDSNFEHGFVAVATSEAAMLGIRANGSAIAWGSKDYGADTQSVESQLTSGVVAAVGNRKSFSILKNDGAVVAWGETNEGGSIGSANVSSGVLKLYATARSFGGLKNDGSFVLWGRSDYIDTSSLGNALTSGVSDAVTSFTSYVILKTNGSAYTVGWTFGDGIPSYVQRQLLADVDTVVMTHKGFAALKGDGSVVSWGDVGDAPSSVSSGVVKLFANPYSNTQSIAALKADGSLFSWGGLPHDAQDSTPVQDQLMAGVWHVAFTDGKIAALKRDGSVVHWGKPTHSQGTYPTFELVADQLQDGVVGIASTRAAFAAFKRDGSVVTWGDSSEADSSAWQHVLANTIAIGSPDGTQLFYAVTVEGEVVYWGTGGGTASGLHASLRNGVAAVAPGGSSIMVLAPDGMLVGENVAHANGSLQGYKTSNYYANFLTPPVMLGVDATNLTCVSSYYCNSLAQALTYFPRTNRIQIIDGFTLLVPLEIQATNLIITGTRDGQHATAVVHCPLESSLCFNISASYLYMENLIITGTDSMAVALNVSTYVRIHNVTIQGAGAGMQSRPVLLVRGTTNPLASAWITGVNISNVVCETSATIITRLLRAHTFRWSFSNVTSTGNGGGCIHASEISSLVIGHSSFRTCSSQGAGGAVVMTNMGYSVSVHHSEFVSCRSFAEAGGAVKYEVTQDTTPTFSLSSCRFQDNEAVSGGAVALVDLSAAPTVPPVLLSNCSFYRNKAKDRGGAILLTAAPKYYENDDGSELQTRAPPPQAKLNCLYMFSNAGSRGGGAAMTGYEISMSDTIVSHNTATQAGGGIHASGSMLRLYHVDISNNTLAGAATSLLYGGGMAVSSCVESGILLQAVLLRGNSLQGNGSGAGAYVSNCEVAVHGLYCVSNSAGSNAQVEERSDASGGGLALTMFTSLTGKELVLESNVASGAGGGLYATDCLSLEVASLEVVNNSASRGGGVYVESILDIAALERCTLRGNAATLGGGGLAVVNSAVSINTAECLQNTALPPDDHDDYGYESTASFGVGRGGCLLVHGASAISLADIEARSNTALWGGDVYWSCHSALQLQRCVFDGSAAVAGDAMYAECHTPWLSNITRHANAVTLAGATASPTAATTAAVSCAVEASASALYESAVLDNEPVLLVSLRAQNGRVVAEDSFTSCTLSIAAAGGASAQLLERSAFVATDGYVAVQPFGFQGLNVASLRLTLACSGVATAFAASAIIPVQLPTATWADMDLRVVPSDTRLLFPVTPAPTLHLTLGQVPAASLSGVVCYLSVTQGLEANDADARLLGGTSTIPVNGTAVFAGVGVDAPFGAHVTLTARCDFRSGAFIEPQSQTRVVVANASVTWNQPPPAVFLPSVQPAAGFVMTNFFLLPALSFGAVDANIPCALQLAPQLPTPDVAFQLAAPVSVATPFTGTPRAVPEFEIQARREGVAMATAGLQLTARCLWVNNRYIVSPPLLLTPPGWEIDLIGPARARRLDLITLQATVRLRHPEALNGHKNASAWFLKSLTCTLSSPQAPGALNYRDNIHSATAPYDESRQEAMAEFRVRLDGGGRGSALELAVACSCNGLVLGNATVAIQMVTWSLTWAYAPGTWLPSSGDYQPPITPALAVAVEEDGQPVNGTDNVQCDVHIISSLGGNEGVTLILNPPGGYSGTSLSHLVHLDRVILRGSFHDVAVLGVSCRRGLEELQLPAVNITLSEPVLALIAPLPPPFLGSGESFAVHAAVLPANAMTRGFAALSCALVALNITMKGATATAMNGSVAFPAVAATGKLATTHDISLRCSLGSHVLSTAPAFTVTIQPCMPGTEPDATFTQCIACSPNTHSPGHLAPCASCPPSGATCAAGRLALQPGFFPANTAHLQGGGAASAALTGEAVFYECWNDEACTLNTTAQTIACSDGYSGPLCGVCEEDAGYVTAGTACVQCWPEYANILFLAAVMVLALVVLTYVAAFQRVKEATAPKIILRITLTYIQMLSSLGMFRAQATSTVRSMIGATEAVGSSVAAAPPVQCLLRLSFYGRFALSVALPFVLIPLSMVCGLAAIAFRSLCEGRKGSTTWGTARILNSTSARGDTTDPSQGTSGGSGGRTVPSQCTSLRRGVRQYWSDKAFVAPALFILFFFYNSITVAVAKMYQCRPEIIDGRRYLAADMRVTCFDGAHGVGMAVTAVIALVFNIGFPVGLLLLLRRKADALSSPAVFTRFGFLYQGYSLRRRMYGWESAVLLRKFVVVAAAGTLDDPWYQAMAGIAVVIAALLLQVKYAPYDDALFNRLEEGVLLTLAVTQVTTLLYLRAEVMPLTPEKRSQLDVVVTCALFTLNGAMFMTLVACAGRRCLRKLKARRLHGPRKHDTSETSVLMNPPPASVPFHCMSSESNHNLKGGNPSYHGNVSVRTTRDASQEVAWRSNPLLSIPMSRDTKP